MNLLENDGKFILYFIVSHPGALDQFSDASFEPLYHYKMIIMLNITLSVWDRQSSRDLTQVVPKSADTADLTVTARPLHTCRSHEIQISADFLRALIQIKAQGTIFTVETIGLNRDLDQDGRRHLNRNPSKFILKNQNSSNWV